MKATCPHCSWVFDVPHPHLTDEGFVPVRLHRRKKRTLYVRREDMQADIADQILALEHENQLLRGKVTSLTGTDTTSEGRTHDR